MDITVFKRALAECRRVAKTIELNFFGEQTMHPNYIAFMEEMAKDRPFLIFTNTNLSLLDYTIMDCWINANLDQVRFSVDAISPDVFDIARPGKVLTLKGKVVNKNRLEIITEKIHVWLEKPNHCPTRLVFVESQYNVDETNSFVEYWLKYLGDKDEILVKPVISYGGKIADPTIMAGKCNIWDIKTLQIDWRGIVSPCNLDTNMDLALGSIMEYSLDELYKNTKASELKKTTGCGNPIVPCSTCIDSNNWSTNRIYKNH